LGFDYDCSTYEKQAVERLNDSIHEFLDDDRLINQLAGVIKGAIGEAYAHHKDRADQIKRAHSMIFKEEEI